MFWVSAGRERAARRTRAGRVPDLDVRRRALAATRACLHHPFLRTPRDWVMKRTPFFLPHPTRGTGCPWCAFDTGGALLLVSKSCNAWPRHPRDSIAVCLRASRAGHTRPTAWRRRVASVGPRRPPGACASLNRRAARRGIPLPLSARYLSSARWPCPRLPREITPLPHERPRQPHAARFVGTHP